MAKDKSVTTPDLKTRVSRMFCNESMSDVTFVVDDPPYRFACHKFVLGIGSQVFEAMFFGKIPEKSPVHIPDVTVAGFRIMLKYLYSDVITIENELDAFETAYVSQKYMVENLFKACENYLLNKAALDPQTVFSIYEEASFLQMKKLKASCLRYVSRNAKKIFSSKAFLGASKETIKDIFKIDFMVIDSECELVQALWFWGEEQCRESGMLCSVENVRKFTQDLMKYLRFSSISTDDLKQILAKCHFADTSEIFADILQWLESDKENNNANSVEISPTSSRSSFSTRSIVNCARINVPTEYRYDGNLSKFSIDEQSQKCSLTVLGPDIIIIGFVVAFKPIPCYSSVHRCLELEFIICNASKNAQTRVKDTLKADHSSEVEKTLMLDDFMVVSEGDFCEIIVILLGEGVRILNCVKDKFSSEVGSSHVSLEFNVQDDSRLLPIKEIVCKPT